MIENHYNFIAIDGADNISTASGVQKTTPSTDAVREFRVINNTYGVEAGRAVGGIVNIITKSGNTTIDGPAHVHPVVNKLPPGRNYYFGIA